MARLLRLAVVPLTLGAAVAPVVAQADTGQGAATQSAALLGSLGSTKLYPFAGSRFDPFSHSLNATVAGMPLNSVGVSETFADGLPVQDLPVYSGLMKANADAQAEGDATVTADRDMNPSSSTPALTNQ